MLSHKVWGESRPALSFFYFYLKLHTHEAFVKWFEAAASGLPQSFFWVGHSGNTIPKYSAAQTHLLHAWLGTAEKQLFLQKAAFCGFKGSSKHTFAEVLWFGFFTWLPRACTSLFSICELHFNALFAPSDLTLVFCQLCSLLLSCSCFVFKLICGHWSFGYWGSQRRAEITACLKAASRKNKLLTLVEWSKKVNYFTTCYFPLLLLQVLSKICSWEHMEWNIFLSPQPQ